MTFFPPGGDPAGWRQAYEMPRNFEPTAGHRDNAVFEHQFFDFAQADFEREIAPDRADLDRL
ncbi:hypothetical protein CCGE531_27010 (plasmid) [Rhizobium sp. CCGE531]|nr:hypothetical protein CCGE531_27010 [Rhizobium sp. CCGE531]AYG76142.1 hypothetical protein CCGE532_26495 [Rhizobium sp. CCGE532]